MPGRGFRIAEGYIQVSANSNEADRDIRGFVRDVNGRLHDLRGRYVAEGREHGRLYGDNLSRGFDRSRFREIFSRILGFGRSLARVFGLIFASLIKLETLATAVGAVASLLGGLAGAAAKLIPVLAGVAQVARAAAPALLLYPGIIATVMGAFLVLKLGLSGVSKAFSALAKGDMERFNEALKKLAPNAQAFAKVVKDMWKALDQIRLDVQNVLFAGLDEQLKAMAKTTIPVLHGGLIGIAGAINSDILGALQGLQSASGLKFLDQIFGAIAKTVSNFAPVMKPIVEMLLAVVAAGTQAVAILSGGAIDSIAAFADRITQMGQSGALRASIMDGVAALGMFKDLLVDIGGIITGVFGAAGSNNGLFTFFDRLHQLVDENQEPISQFFQNLNVIGSAMQPVWAALLGGIAQLSAAIGEISLAFAPGLAELVAALGEALASLSPAIIALAPALPAITSGLQPLADILRGLVQGFAPGFVVFVQELAKGLSLLAPVAEPVGKALGDLLAALSPLLPLIASLASDVLAVLAYELSGLSAILGPTIQLFADGLTTALQMFLPVALQATQTVLPLLAQAGLQIMQAFAPLVPILLSIAQQIVQQLIPFIPQFVAVLVQLIPIVVQLAQQFGQALLMALISIAPYIPQLVANGLMLVLTLTQLFLTVAPLLPQLMQFAMFLFSVWIQSGQLQVGMQILVDSLQNAIGVMLIIIGVVRMVIGIFDAAKEAAYRLGSGIRGGIDVALAVIRGLPGAAAAALGDLGGVLFNAGKRLIQGLIDGINGMLGALKSALGKVTSMIPDWKGPEDKDRKLLYPAGRAIMTGLKGGIESSLPGLRAALENVTAQLQLGGTAGALAGAGGATYNFHEGAIVLDASRIKDIGDLLEMLGNIKVTARKHGSSQ